MKRWQRIGFLIFLTLLLASGMFFFALKRGKLVAPGGTQSARMTPTPTQIPLVTWEDPAGFTFQYSAELTVDKHPEDTKSYAHIELTSPTHPGKLIVWAKDPPLGKAGSPMVDVDKWVSTQKQFTAGTIIDTTLGGQAAKKVRFSSPDHLVTGVIFDELLVTVETSLGDLPYWSDVHEIVSRSFAFAPAKEENSGNGESFQVGENADEEETLQ